MLPKLRRSHSAILFDVGTSGVRMFQVNRAGSGTRLIDALRAERNATAALTTVEGAAPPDWFDAEQLRRFIGQGRFIGTDIGLVLSPPDVKFVPLALPEAALARARRLGPTAIAAALKVELAQAQRGDSDEFEVCHWDLPAARGTRANVMVAAVRTDVAARWCTDCAAQGLTLTRLEVLPSALVRGAAEVAPAEAGEVWGILDLGHRHTTMTVVLGNTPVYIRGLAAGQRRWIDRLSEAFEITPAVAHELLHTHGLQSDARAGVDRSGGRDLFLATDVGGAVTCIVQEELAALGREVERCFAYVLQAYPCQTAPRIFLAGSGACVPRLDAVLERCIGVPVACLAPPAGSSTASFGTTDAAAYGAALLDRTRKAGARGTAGTKFARVNLLPYEQRVRRVRRQHRTRWIVACGAAALLAIVGQIVQLSAQQAVRGLTDRVATLTHERARAAERLKAAAATRDVLLEGLGMVSAACRPQPWPQRLAALAEAAPAGICLTDLTVEPPGTAATNAKAQAGEAAPNVQRVRLTGYALDHATLNALLQRLQTLDGWGHVELTRAVAEPRQGRIIVAFELTCEGVEAAS